MKTILKKIIVLALLFSWSYIVAQQNFTVKYTFDSDGVPQIESGEGFAPATVAYGGNKQGTVEFTTDGTAQSMKAPIIQNNATNYNTNFIQMDIVPSDGYGIKITNIKITHRSDEVNNVNFFRIGCNSNGLKPSDFGRDPTDQSTGNIALSDTYINSSFSPGNSVNNIIGDATGSQYLSAFLTARGNTNTTFNWYIDEVEITGTYQANALPYPIVFSLDDYKGSKVTKWSWDLKGSSVNTSQANTYYGTQANVVRFPIYAPAHLENGAILTSQYQTKISQLKNLLTIRPDVKVFISLKLSGSTTFPDWVASNEDGNIFGATVKKPDPEKYSDLLAGFLQYMEDEGIPIYYFAPGNEVASAIDAERHYDIMRLLRPKLTALGISNDFKIVAPDAYSHTETEDWMQEYLTHDPELEYIDILGTHYYASRGSEASWKAFKDDYNKPVWYTEAGFGPLVVSGSTTFPSMAGLRKRFAQVTDAINGGANHITYWQGAGNPTNDIFYYFKINFIDQVFGFQPVESDIIFTGQDVDHFNIPFFQTFRDGRDVIIYAINPRTETFEHSMFFDKNYDLGTVNKQTFTGTSNDNTYTIIDENLTLGTTNEINAIYPATSITVYRFELPDALYESNAAPIVRTPQIFNYDLDDNTLVGDIVGKVLADDADANEITYTITGGTGIDIFEVGNFSALITLKDKSLIPIGTSTYTLEVVASDSSSSSVAQTVNINITNTTLGINDFQNIESKIIVYPNPTNSKFTISGKNIEKVKLMDLSGKLIFTKNVLSTDEIDMTVEQLKAGIYILNIKTDNNEFHKKLVIK